MSFEGPELIEDDGLHSLVTEMVQAAFPDHDASVLRNLIDGDGNFTFSVSRNNASVVALHTYRVVYQFLKTGWWEMGLDKAKVFQFTNLYNADTEDGGVIYTHSKNLCFACTGNWNYTCVLAKEDSLFLFVHKLLDRVSGPGKAELGDFSVEAEDASFVGNYFANVSSSNLIKLVNNNLNKKSNQVYATITSIASLT